MTRRGVASRPVPGAWRKLVCDGLMLTAVAAPAEAMRHARVTVIRSLRDSGQVGGRVDDPVVAPQNTAGEGDITLTSEPEAEGPADAV